jgi:queuine/archaeosine tRNA-ribosyltransferase
VQYRQDVTLELASLFLDRHRRDNLRFTPLGAAQGWSPSSYARAVDALQKMGYSYIAIGGMVPLKTTAIIACLEAISAVRKPTTKLHLLGVTRCEHINAFASYGVASFDSTSPLRQAFKDDKDNYYAPAGAYTAIRIPQIEANAKLMKRIRSGEVSQERARKLERECLAAMKGYARRSVSLDETLALLLEYERVYDGKRSHEAAYRKTLTDRPWEDCDCEVCRALGYHVILFRGAERNRRRGFHNLWVFYRRVHRELANDLRLVGSAS